MAPVPCPLCHEATLTKHCPGTNNQCHWAKCPKCKATVEPRRKRGFDKDGKPVTWT